MNKLNLQTTGQVDENAKRIGELIEVGLKYISVWGNAAWRRDASAFHC